MRLIPRMKLVICNGQVLSWTEWKDMIARK